MTGPDDAARIYAGLYAPTAEELRRQLAELGESLSGQFAELQARPCTDRAERLALNLDGARSMVLRFRERLALEGEGCGR